MGIISNGAAAGAMDAGRFAKKSYKNQVQANAQITQANLTAAQRDAQWQAAILEQMAFQSQMLGRIVEALEADRAT